MSEGLRGALREALGEGVRGDLRESLRGVLGGGCGGGLGKGLGGELCGGVNESPGEGLHGGMGGRLSECVSEGVAEDLGVKPETVLEMESRLSGQDIAFDGPMHDDDDGLVATPAGYLKDMRMEPSSILEADDSETQMKQRLTHALKGLDPRSREILEARWLGEKKSTLHELADRYQVSAERIRQIEKSAMNKLKSQLAA